MQHDHLGNPIYKDADIVSLLYHGNIQFLEEILISPSIEVDQLLQHSELQLKIADSSFDNINKEEFDKLLQEDWFIPEEYKDFDIESYLVNVCPKQNYQRLIEELQEYRARNMLNLLRWLKYFVDTCEKNNIVWGVGRGSSVASYVLYLLKVHRIDSLKYNLDYQDFLR